MENLEWEFQIGTDRQQVDISDCGKKIKSKNEYAWMRLKNKIRINLRYKMNVRVQN